MVADRKKNCFTTPDGRSRAISSPNADPIIAPRKRIKTSKPNDFFRIEIFNLSFLNMYRSGFPALFIPT